MSHTTRITSGPAARITTVAAATVFAATMLAACNGPASTGSSPGPSSCLVSGQPVALAVGARSNSPEPSLTADASVTSALNSAVNAHQPLSIIRLDGQPTVVFSQAFRPTGSNPQAVKAEYNTYIGQVNQVLDGTPGADDIRSKAPQANDLEALTITAGEVPPGGNVIVMDSGLQTTEPLNFTDNLLADSPQTIVADLKGAKELPDLSGRHVDFVGLGWSAAPQPDLGTPNRDKLASIWKDIATAAGASCVTVDQTPNTSSELPGRPPVTVVTPPPPPPVPGPCTTISLNDANNVGFQFNSTDFLDPAGARSTLSKIAKVMQIPGESLTLTGSTSSEGTESYNNQLSLARANAVKAVLGQLGVPASRITTFGDGAHLPGRANDRGQNGQLLIGPAIADRKVVVKLTGTSCGA